MNKQILTVTSVQGSALWTQACQWSYERKNPSESRNFWFCQEHVNPEMFVICIGSERVRSLLGSMETVLMLWTLWASGLHNSWWVLFFVSEYLLVNRLGMRIGSWRWLFSSRFWDVGTFLGEQKSFLKDNYWSHKSSSQMDTTMSRMQTRSSGLCTEPKLGEPLGTLATRLSRANTRGLGRTSSLVCDKAKCPFLLFLHNLVHSHHALLHWRSRTDLSWLAEKNESCSLKWQFRQASLLPCPWQKA